ncbi:MFS transporter [Actinoallomurus sp. CA-150999]|uniref:MFS transporter n=1 Tax=Actinoallomurus sp. CA-150999 TaxID=3239887 RepID=UPI003D91F7A3
MGDTTSTPASGTSGLSVRSSDACLIAARLDRIPPNAFHGRLAGLLAGGTFFDAFDAVSIAVGLTVIKGYFKIGFSEAGLIVSAGYLGQLVGAFFVGALAEKAGRRRAFIISLVVFGGVSIAAALSWSATSLLVFRMVQGLGLGAEVPLAATLMNEFLDSRHRGRIGLLYQSAFAWGILIAPLAGVLLIGKLDHEAGWRWLFAVGALPLLMAVAAWRWLPESPRWLAEHGRITEADAIVSNVEKAAARRGTVLPEPEATSPQHAGRLRLAELFSAAYRRRTVMLWVSWFATFFVTYGFNVWLPTLYVTLGGLAPSASLGLTVISSAVQVIGVYAGAFLIDRIGRKPLLVAGFALMAAGTGFGTIGVSVLQLTAWPVLFAAGLVIAAGVSLPATILYVYTAELYPTRMRAWGSSAASGFNRSASVISPIVISQVLAAGGGVSLVFGIMLIAAVLGLVVLAGMGIETRNRTLEELAR